MTDKNTEYELFKSFARLQLVEITNNELHILEAIKNKGLQINQVEGGYRTTEIFEPLLQSHIRLSLDPEIDQFIDKLEVIYETESTNTTIKSNPANQFYSVLAAEYQSNGQGRRAKQWCSPLASNLYFSLQFSLKNANNSHLIPLICARSVCNVLLESGFKDCTIKWPNDIYIRGRKVAGILCESRYNSQNGLVFVVGVGLNVNMMLNDGIDQSWTSLRICQGKLFNRNVVLSSLLCRIISDFNRLTAFNITHFKRDWQSLDYLYGKTIRVTDEKSTYTAIAAGISDDGALIVQYNGQTHTVFSADVSVKSIEKFKGLM